MIAVDTNVLARYVVRDDETQAKQAQRLIATSDVFVGVTVVLELEWVLRSRYGYDRHRIVNAIRGIAGRSSVRVERARAVAQALDHAEQGMDLADAMHLALRKDATGFATFDRAMIREAAALGIPDVREP